MVPRVYVLLTLGFAAATMVGQTSATAPTVDPSMTPCPAGTTGALCMFKFGCGCPPGTTSCTLCDPEGGILDLCEPDFGPQQPETLAVFPTSAKTLVAFLSDGKLEASERAAFEDLVTMELPPDGPSAAEILARYGTTE